MLSEVERVLESAWLRVGHNWPIYSESQGKVGEHSSRSATDFPFGHIWRIRQSWLMRLENTLKLNKNFRFEGRWLSHPAEEACFFLRLMLKY